MTTSTTSRPLDLTPDTLQAILDAAPDLIAVVDGDTRVEFAGVKLRDALGDKLHERLDDGALVNIVPEDLDLFVGALHSALKTGEPFHIRCRFLQPDGTTKTYDFEGSRVPGDDPRVLLVAREVTETVRMIRQLEESKSSAERANLAKADLMSRMSHELRTPLNAILGFAQLLQLDALTEDQTENLHHIEKAGSHLLKLVNEVLNMTSLEAGRLSLSIEPVSLDMCITEVADLTSPMASSRGITLEWDASCEGGLHVLADAQRLKQVLLNVVNNAIKYNRVKGSARIVCAHEDEIVVVEVSDTGPGIPRERMGHLFAPFDRLGAENTDEEGTGLGLPLSRRLVEAMGGTLTCRSVPGEGSTFRIELRAATAVAPPAPGGAGDARVEPVLRSGQQTILYVEDNLSNLKLIERMIARHDDRRLLVAMQGTLGVEIAQEHDPDLVLLDMNLPDMTGAEVLRLLRGDPRTSAIPVIMLSADATKGQIERLLKAGARAYLTKPLDLQEFDRVLDEVLR